MPWLCHVPELARTSPQGGWRELGLQPAAAICPFTRRLCLPPSRAHRADTDAAGGPRKREACASAPELPPAVGCGDTMWPRLPRTGRVPSRKEVNRERVSVPSGEINCVSFRQRREAGQLGAAEKAPGRSEGFNPKVAGHRGTWYSEPWAVTSFCRNRQGPGSPRAPRRRWPLGPSPVGSGSISLTR